MSVIEYGLKGKRVLVTGATGFIGGRIAQRLATEEEAIVTGLGRNLAAVPFLKEAGVEMRRADLQSHDDMKAALEGQEVVFHVAAWLGDRHGADEAAFKLNVNAVEDLIRLSAEQGIKRFIAVSSIAAYGKPYGDMAEDTTPLAPNPGDMYGRSKAAGEEAALRTGKEVGVEVAVIRPAMVYGPRSYSWSVGMLNLVKKRVPVIFGDGNGHSFPVYVDNLIDGMLLTAVKDEAVGEAFNFCDPPITWNEFFGYYGRMCGRKPLRVPKRIAIMVAHANDWFKLGLPLDRVRLQYYWTNAAYSTAKATRLLGYKQRVSIPEGMAITEAWFKKEGLL